MSVTLTLTLSNFHRLIPELGHRLNTSPEKGGDGGDVNTLRSPVTGVTHGCRREGRCTRPRQDMLKK